MEFVRRGFCLLLVLFSGFVSVSIAHELYVGGRDGWVLNPSEEYNHWSSRYRFHVNDSLIFKFKEGSDSVLMVDKDDYNNCNRDNPIKKMESGESVFKFEDSGSFFFISGNNNGACEKGQKLSVIVMGLKRRVVTPANGPSSHAPVLKPSVKAAAAASPTKSPSPSADTPATSPTPATPASSPAPTTPDVSDTPVPSPSSASRVVVKPSVLYVTAVTMVLSVAFGSKP